MKRTLQKRTSPLVDISLSLIDGVIKDYISSKGVVKGYPSITGKEHSYVLKLKDPFVTNSDVRRNDLEIKVLTSIKVNSEVPAEYGKDSIKVIIVDSRTQRIVYKFPRIYRTDIQNVVRKLSLYIDKAVNWIKKIPICSKCGNPMALLKSTRRDGSMSHYYWGCVRYPFCKNKIIYKQE